MHAQYIAYQRIFATKQFDENSSKTRRSHGNFKAISLSSNQRLMNIIVVDPSYCLKLNRDLLWRRRHFRSARLPTLRWALNQPPFVDKFHTRPIRPHCLWCSLVHIGLCDITNHLRAPPGKHLSGQSTAATITGSPWKKVVWTHARVARNDVLTSIDLQTYVTETKKQK